LAALGTLAARRRSASSMIARNAPAAARLDQA